MTISHSPTDSRPVTVTNPRALDDDPISKAQSVPNPPTRPVPHDRLQGVVVKKVSK